jgi:hypothetical protein
VKRAPVAPRVQAASVTAAVSGGLLWILGHYVFRSAVPDGVASLIYAAVPGALALAAGWLAPHQPRAGGAGGGYPSPYPDIKRHRHARHAVRAAAGGGG